MSFSSDTLSDVQTFINENGTIVRFRHFTKVFNAGSYDDDVSLVSGTDTWTTGLIHPLGNSENHLVQEGLLQRDDIKVYVDGSVNVSGLWRMGVGSPPTTEYALAQNNLVESPHVNGSVTYNKMYVRKLLVGSLFGE